MRDAKCEQPKPHDSIVLPDVTITQTVHSYYNSATKKWTDVNETHEIPPQMAAWRMNGCATSENEYLPEKLEESSIFKTLRMECPRDCDRETYSRAASACEYLFLDLGSWKRIEITAMQIIEKYTPPEKLAEIAECRSNGSRISGVPTHVFDVPDDAPPVARDAAEVLHFGWLSQAILKSGKNPEWGFQFALGVGRAYERMLARSAEPAAATGKKIKTSAKEGHAATHGTDAEKQARRLEYCREVDHRRRPGVKLERIYAQVAEKFGVSEKTIRRALNWRKSLDTAGHCPD